MTDTKIVEEGFDIIFGKKIESIISFLQDINNEEYRIEETILSVKDTADKNKLTLSGVFKKEEFPLHSDGAHFVLPPRWIILEFISDKKSNVATLLTDTIPLASRKEYEGLLVREIYLVRGGPISFLTSILNTNIINRPIFRWNPIIMKPLIKVSEFSVSDLYFEQIQRVIWEPSKILVIDNWRMLHGRESAIIEDSKNRLLKRYYLTPKNSYAGF